MAKCSGLERGIYLTDNTNLKITSEGQYKPNIFTLCNMWELITHVHACVLIALDQLFTPLESQHMFTVPAIGYIHCSS